MSESVIFRPIGPVTTMPLTTVPGIPGLFAKLVALSMFRPSSLSTETRLENLHLVFDNYRMDPEIIQRFKKVCGYGQGSEAPAVPAPYIQTLFIGLISKFISSPHFPINPMGLIQVGQSYEMIRPVSPDTVLNLSCHLLEMTQTEKGIHTRFQQLAKSEGDPVWQGIATYFTRAKNPPPKKKSDPKAQTPLTIQETISVPANIGRQYAAVSRDYNPHHLYGWTAKFIGFKQAIAHGIWSLARAGASLEKAFGYPDCMGVESVLKLPIFLPATITLGYETGKGVTSFELTDAQKGLPHLKGTFKVF